MTLPLWILIGLQMAMGAFDILFHHELTERLAWRKSQRHELQLHGVRNLFYAVIFAGLGFVQVYGVLALAVIAVLVAEVGITLKDFVEEDRSRKLPASERVTHTLLALNYGAILALLLPVLVGWVGQPVGIATVNHGWWSVLCAVGGAGCLLFGVRDLAAAARLGRMGERAAAGLIDPAAGPRTVLVTGGTGFIGGRLVAALVGAGDRVIVLTRDAKGAMETLPAPVRLVTGLDQIGNDERIHAIVNLAGQPVAGFLWTAQYRRKVYRSRIRLTRQVIGLIERLETKPDVLVSGSAIGVYGVSPTGAQRENSAIVEDGSFAQRLCLAWEREARRAEGLARVRTVKLRIGLVLGTDGGPLSQMLVPFEFGLGGQFGNGTHTMSWISRDDLVRLIGFAMANDRVRGPLNGTAPFPTDNRSFTQALGNALGRPAVLPAPRWALEALGGDLAREILLADQEVLPRAAIAAGFVFIDPELQPALDRLVGRPGGRQRPLLPHRVPPKTV
ncbi:MAG: TIGR01777 family oxidoreductase [Pseudomonadota bacterium]